MGCGYTGPRPTPKLHPHLRLEETMTSVPKVVPGDMVFWHCVRVSPTFLNVLAYASCPFLLQDVVHSVETKHTGTTDSAGRTLDPFHGALKALIEWVLSCSDVHRRCPEDTP